MAKVFVTRRLPGPALDRLRIAHQVVIHPGRLAPTREELELGSEQAAALITTVGDTVDAALIEKAPRLEAIANFAVGTDNIDLAAADDRGIAVGNTPDVLTDATAELAFALLLAAARRFDEAIAAVTSGRWRTWEPAGFLGAPVAGATLAVVGYGRIGRATAKLATGFGMRVIHSGEASFLRLLAEADYVSLHTPLNETTRHLIDEAALAEMKRTAHLINTARGGIVDQAALIDAVRQNRLAGAALDVTEPEPPEVDDPILHTPGILVTPHIGSATTVARHRMAAICVENILAALDGRPMPHPASRSNRRLRPA